MSTPALPHSVLVELGADLESPGAADRLAAAIAADRTRLRGRLRGALAQPAVRAAIAVESPQLARDLAAWDERASGRRADQLERALYGCLARMAGRPVPSGLLAGWAMGSLGERTELVVGDGASCRRHTRLDARVLSDVMRALARWPGIRDRFDHHVSSSLYRVDDRVRWIASDRAGASKHRLMAAELTPHLAVALQRAEGRGAPLGELAQAVRELDPEIELDEALGYVRELVDAEILAPAIDLPLTGDDPLADAVAQLRGAPECDEASRWLSEIRSALGELDRGGTDRGTPEYSALVRALEPLGVNREPARLVDVELAKPSPCGTLGRDVVREALHGVELLRRFTRPDPRLRRFAEAFVARYGDAEVPLLEVLDEDTGIGFDAASAPAVEAAPLVAGLAFGAAAPGTRFDARDGFLARRIEDVQRRGEIELRLSTSDLERLGERTPAALPLSFAVVARIARAGIVVVDRVIGPSGASLIARLARSDPDLRAHLVDHTRAEEKLRPDAVFAEIVHLPDARLANRIARPVLRGLEVPYAGGSGAPLDRQLSARDLVVSIDPDEQIVVRSLRYDREVIPRITCAGDPPASSVAVYRFLHALQGQGSAPVLAFRWGPLDALAFLPRVSSGRVVLHTARWRLDRDQLRGLGRDGAARLRAVRELRAALAMPRWVELVEDDRRLPLDLDNPLCVELLGHRIRRRATAILAELYPSMPELCAAGPDGSYLHELVIPFVRGGSPRRRPARTAPRAATRTGFAIGSEWLQVQLYGAAMAADHTLRDVVAPVVEEGAASGAIAHWFFIRYADPDDHLCVRFCGSPAALVHTIVPAIAARVAALEASSRVRTFTLGEYRREVERYGGPAGIELAERVFCADSEAVLGVVRGLASMEPDQAEEARWRLALRGIDTLLDDLMFDVPTKLAVISDARAVLDRMLSSHPEPRALARRYRIARPVIDRTLDPAARDGELAWGVAVLDRRSERVAPVARELASRAAAGRLVHSLPVVARSYVHMFANRILRTAALAQELVLYDWLARSYRSRLARKSR